MNKHFNNRIAITMLLLGGLTIGACSSKKENDPLEASGIIETTDVTVSSRVAGNIIRLNVHEGDNIHTGDTLLVVDDTDLRLQRQQLVAAVDVARAGFDLSRNGARAEDIDQSDEAVSQAKVNLDNAADDEKRYGELLKIGSISERDYQNAKAKYEVALRQYRSAQIGSQKLRHGSRSEDIAAAEARVAQAEALVAATDKKITDCVVLSPIDGVVTRRGVEQGEFVTIGTGMLTISQSDRVKLKIYIPENELGKVKLGQPAELVIDSYNDRKYRGKVTYISPTAEFTPKNVQTKDDRVKLVFEVQIEALNKDGDLKSGLTADARLLPPENVVGGK